MLVFTDGSCLKNNNGGWAFCIVDEKEDILVSCGETNTTNNRMELTAVIEALKYLKENFDVSTCVVKTDSQLTMNCGQKKWKRNKNIDLWEIFDKLNSSIHIQWEWVKAHNGNHYNELVDKSAKKEAESLTDME